jgi:hypothetical protein
MTEIQVSNIDSAILNEDEEISHSENTSIYTKPCGKCLSLYAKPCTIFWQLVIMIGLLVALVVLIIYDIFALKENTLSDIHDLCEESNIWEYVLVELICVCISLVIHQKKDDDTICNMFIPLAMMIWGSIEIFSVNCVNELNHMLIYQMAIIHLAASYFVVILTVVLTLFVLIMSKKD